MPATHKGTIIDYIRGLTAAQQSSEQADGDLLDAFLRQNDQLAFETLVRRHGPMVLRVCRRVLGNVHDAEDTLQAAFLVLAQKAKSIRKKTSLASWLHGVAYRMAKHANRAGARRRTHESEVKATVPPDPAFNAASRELQAILDEEIERLPDGLRATFVYVCLENHSCVEAARQLGLEETAVRMRLNRARKRLQERLARRGISLTAALAAVAIGTSPAGAALPRSLVGALVKAAALVAAGQAVPGGLVSAKVLSLLKGINRTMTLTKLKTVTLLLATIPVAGIGYGVVTHADTRVQGGFSPELLAARADDISESPQATPKSPRPSAPSEGPAEGDRNRARLALLKKVPKEEQEKKEQKAQPLTSKELSGTWEGEKEGVQVRINFLGDDKVTWRVNVQKPPTGEDNASIVGELKREDDKRSGTVHLRFYSTKDSVVMAKVERDRSGALRLTILPAATERGPYRPVKEILLRKEKAGEDMDRPIRTLSGHTDRVTAVACSPDGRWVATAAWDGTARLWETPTGKQVRRLDVPPPGTITLNGASLLCLHLHVDWIYHSFSYHAGYITRMAARTSARRRSL